MMDGAGMFGASHNHVPTSMITIDFERVNSSRHDCYSPYLPSIILPEDAVPLDQL